MGNNVALLKKSKKLQFTYLGNKRRYYPEIFMVGHRVLLRSEHIVLFSLWFLANYKTQKNNAFFCVLLLKAEKNAMNATFFCKERKRKQRTQYSLAKERKKTQSVALRSFEKNACPALLFFQYIYI